MNAKEWAKKEAIRKEKLNNAAPELLEALERLVKNQMPISVSIEPNKDWDKACAAIAKAKGEA